MPCWGSLRSSQPMRLENRAPCVPGEEGLADLRVVDAAFASAKADGKRVEIAQG